MPNKFKAYYIFDSEEQYEQKIQALKEKYEEEEKPFYSSVILNEYKVLEQATYDEEGNELTPKTIDNTKFLVNMFWRGIEIDEQGKGQHPYGWKTYAKHPITPDFEGWGLEVLKYNMED